MDYLQEIKKIKKEIDALKPLPADLEARIMQKFRLDWNYNSNSIEGNRLTFGETKTFLLHGITADGKPLKDHLDIKGHNQALLLLEDIVKEERPVTESFIRELHKLILQEDYYNEAITPQGTPTKRLIKIGQYKQAPNHVKTVTGEIFRFASPEETPAEMNQLMSWLQKEQGENNLEAVELAALFHYKFIRIHPFDDGNGRLARILMNLLLMNQGYPPVVIKVEEKEKYYTALQKADGGDLLAFSNYIAKELKDSLELYLRGAKGENIEDLNDFDKRLTLLKQKFENKKEKVASSSEILELLHVASINPFMKKVEELIQKFSDLFVTSSLLLKKELFNLGTGKFFTKYVDSYDIDGESKLFEFKMILKEFKYNPTLDCEVDIDLSFNKYNYSISANLNSEKFDVSIKKDYGTFIEEEEQKKMINAIGDAIIKRIESASSNEEDK